MVQAGQVAANERDGQLTDARVRAQRDNLAGIHQVEAPEGCGDLIIFCKILTIFFNFYLLNW